MSSYPLPSIKVSDPPVEGDSGHAQVPSDMGGGLSLFDESSGVGNLVIAEGRTPAPEVHARIAAFGVGSTTAFDARQSSGREMGSSRGLRHSCSARCRTYQ